MFDLATAKTRLSITDTTQDVAVQASLDAALSLAERYCNRGFLYKAERVRFYDTTAGSLPIPRYPIESVTKMSLGGKYHILKEAGTILLHDHNHWALWDNGREVTVEYTGGYKTLPPDLVIALWEIFDNLWSRANASGGAGAVAGGAIQSITSDGATVRFDTSGGSASSTPTALNVETGLPFSAQSILDLYRREVA